MSSGVSDQVRLKLACSATEASRSLEILVTETRDITLSRQRTTKALIRLRGFSHGPAYLYIVALLDLSISCDSSTNKILDENGAINPRIVNSFFIPCISW